MIESTKNDLIIIKYVLNDKTNKKNDMIKIKYVLDDKINNFIMISLGDYTMTELIV